MTVSSALGVDTNVFLSDDSDDPRQTPRSSTFTQTNINATVGTDSGRTQRLGWTVRGMHRHYFRFGEADKLFADSALAYRYALAPSLLLGIIQTISYARMQLLDTEGNTLPRERFISYSGEARGYAQVLAGHSLLTVGAGIRRKDINEVADQGPLTFRSLDHRGYFAYADAAYRLQAAEFELGYEYGVTHYDELQVTARDGSTNSSNPLLTLIQHTARSRIGVSPIKGARLSVDGQERWVLDPFEKELTYRQVDVKPRLELQLPMRLSWSAGAGYRTRMYVERPTFPGSPDRRRERFLLADTTLRKSWTRRWSSTLQVQLNRKASNVRGDEFRERLYSVGISLTL